MAFKDFFDKYQTLYASVVIQKMQTYLQSNALVAYARINKEARENFSRFIGSTEDALGLLRIFNVTCKLNFAARGGDFWVIIKETAQTVNESLQQKIASSAIPT